MFGVLEPRVSEEAVVNLSQSEASAPAPTRSSGRRLSRVKTSGELPNPDMAAVVKLKTFLRSERTFEERLNEVRERERKHFVCLFCFFCSCFPILPFIVFCSSSLNNSIRASAFFCGRAFEIVRVVLSVLRLSRTSSTSL